MTATPELTHNPRTQAFRHTLQTFLDVLDGAIGVSGKFPVVDTD